MAENSAFWTGNSGAGAAGDAGPYSQAQLAAFIAAITGSRNGVLGGLTVGAASPNAKKVVLSPGSAIVEGLFYRNDANLELAIPDNSSGNPRIDRVILAVDWAAQTIRAAVKQGTPASTPAAPALTQAVGSVWEEPIANIAVAHGFSSLSDAEITDWRRLRIPGWNVGDLKWIGSDVIPDGWLVSAGQALSRERYAELYALWGTTFGAGDGSTTFNVPDLRGRVLAGKDNMGGTSANNITDPAADSFSESGAESKALSVDNLPDNYHFLQAGGDSGQKLVSAGSGLAVFGSATWITNTVGSSTAFSIVQPTAYGNWCFHF